MKRDRSSVDRRRAEILKMIREREEVKVEQLAKEFGLSLMTVRRDLQYLEDRQLISRFHGGATANLTPRPVTEEEEVQLYRSLIGRFAATKVSDGDTLFINGSRTALGMLDYLKYQSVHIITNNAWAVGQTYPRGVSVTLTGGDLRNHILVGDYVMRNLLTLSADKTFIGCAGVYSNGEFRYDIPTEIGINEAMISRTTKELYILADHTKVHSGSAHENLYGSCTYERPWTLITDEKADARAVEHLRMLGMRVYQVSMDDPMP
ncbi:MAG TPA: DeoR/GlpR transcriptional regulator [Candidatus Onthomonas avicola]|nr:DeoR/GlpR transcriptional regulator [Candidatus Onthomonas avicola]